MRIVVPLDMSNVASTALDLAAEIARGLGDDLLLVTVSGVRLRGDLAPAAGAEGVPVPEMIEAFLKSTMAEIDGVSSDFRVIAGDDASEALIQFASSEPGLRMIVMATHGRSGIERWRLGSVAERVVRHSPIPVAVVPRSG